MTPRQIHSLFERFAAHNPAPATELEYASSFQLLVAVVLSAQATDKGVNLATRGLFRAAPTPQKMAALGVDGIAAHIRSIGLFHNKAKNVAALSALLIERHQGRVPRERAALEALPGVGRKTASVVLNIVFKEPTIAVDTHIFRVANRMSLAPGKTVREVEDGLHQAVPPAFQLHAHHWLILHGRHTCKARRPACRECLASDLCAWPREAAHV